MAKNPKAKPPQILISTTKLAGYGCNLTGGKHSVQLEPEWMLRDERQAEARIDRLGKKEITYSYAIRSEGSAAEKAIWNRKDRRHMLNTMEIVGDDQIVQEDNYNNPIDGELSIEYDDGPDVSTMTVADEFSRGTPGLYRPRDEYLF